jgi:hypothetical protein
VFLAVGAKEIALAESSILVSGSLVLKKMPLWKCQPAFIASQGIIGGLHASSDSRRLRIRADLLVDAIANSSVR